MNSPDYKIVSSASYIQVQQEMNKAAKDGYRLAGQLVVSYKNDEDVRYSVMMSRGE